MRPLDHKLKYQIDKLVRTAVTGSLGKTEVIRFSELCSLGKLWLKGCVSDSMHSKICIYPLMVGVTVSDAFVDFSWKWPTAAASQSRESRQQSKTRVTRRLRFLLLLSHYQTVNTCIQTSAPCISRKDKCLFVFCSSVNLSLKTKQRTRQLQKRKQPTLVARNIYHQRLPQCIMVMSPVCFIKYFNTALGFFYRFFFLLLLGVFLGGGGIVIASL